MNKIKNLLWLLLLAQMTSGQNCGGGRYQLPIFSNTISTKALQFGGDTNVNGNYVDLFMDVYEPIGDTAAQRPLIIWCHGGGFFAQNRTQFEDDCIENAKRGYVSATIDYRLNTNFLVTSVHNRMRTVIQAVQDLKTAISYFKNDARTINQFRVDTNLIFVGGTSAGGITAIHLAYLDDITEASSTLAAAILEEGGLNNISGNLPYHGAEVAGVISLAGAIHDVNFMNLGPQAPLLAIHGDLDVIVPFDDGNAFGIFLQGGNSMNTHAQTIGLQCTFYNLAGRGHNAPKIHNMTDERYYDFMHQIICGSVVSINQHVTDAPVLTYPNPFLEQLSITRIPENTDYVVITNSNGQTIKTIENPLKYVRVNLEDEAPGVYFVACLSAGEIMTCQKILKQ
ncbi:MAG: alpha/beta hydrolase fold domain-containing protein [Flavobacteriales bacterium]|nr:alpha/beta hydrolase fold domain-containing protein [Flavobacteriales bacterium]